MPVQKPQEVIEAIVAKQKLTPTPPKLPTRSAVLLEEKKQEQVAAPIEIKPEVVVPVVVKKVKKVVEDEILNIVVGQKRKH